jgi:hypothetical protein
MVLASGHSYILGEWFEHLISEAFKKAQSDNTITEEEYQQSRMDEKIGLLHAYLPSFLVEKKSMYSILSLGIHELAEEVCLEHFQALRTGIELILDEKLDEIRKNEKIEAAKKKLDSIHAKVKKKE